jgi:SAM-dependent methyltransferase
MPTIEPQSTTSVKTAPEFRPRKILLIGCGSRRNLDFDATSEQPYTLTTLDIVKTHDPDIVWDLNLTPWCRDNVVSGILGFTSWKSLPIRADSFDEVHGYEVLEHLGQQGDAESFFGTFSEIYRVLKPGGLFVGSVPRWDKLWAWGDPSHRRIISEGSLTFLDATAYDQVGQTAMTDFRSIWKDDLEPKAVEFSEHQMFFRLQAHKPSRRMRG